MKGLPFVLAFTAMTFVAWGAYGPLLHHGTASMGRDSVRAFVGVGIAYFFIAVLVPIYILRTQGETGKWTVSGTFYSLIAGAVGALGALGVILALSYGGMPVYVMPLVFGFAPIVNTLVTAWMSKTFDQISPIFIGGIVVAALGVAGVLAFKPSAPPHAAHSTKDASPDKAESKPEKDKDHSQLQRLGSMRYVTTTAIPTQDDLPPVVVQPAAPADVTSDKAAEKAPEQVIAPETKAAEQTAQPASEPQELPPVVVQPAPPADAPKPAATAPEPSAPQTETPATPPVVPQPAEAPAVPTNTPPATETPKPEQPKAEQPKAEEPKPAEVKPSEAKPAEVKPAEAQPQEARPEALNTLVEKPSLPEDENKANAAKKQASSETTHGDTAKSPAPPANVPMIIGSIIVAAICWGSYGPMLHQGQARMSGSRLRPFTCVGLAYFIIAVAAPLAVIASRTADTGAWSAGGLTWSIIAGAAGAIGALGVILAFNAGGKPYYVMPLVFGFAPVINTCISLTEAGTWGLVRPEFWISLAVVISGAITVLITAPKPQHAKPHAPAAK